MVFGRILSVLLLAVSFGLAADPWPTNYLFKARFEQGDPWDFASYTWKIDSTNTTGQWVISTNSPHSGAYCAYVQTTNCHLSQSTNFNLAYFTTPTLNTNSLEMDCRFFFKLMSASLANSDQLWLGALWSPSGNNCGVFLTQTAGNLYLGNNRTTNGTTIVTTNVWHSVDIQFICNTNANSSIVAWKLDGVLQATNGAVNVTYIAQDFRAGVINISAGTSNTFATLYLDDCSVFTNALPQETIGIDVCFPPFDGRLGVPLFITGIETTNGCKVVGTLTGNGYTNQFLSNNITTTLIGRCPLTNLLSETYTISLQLLDTNDTSIVTTNLVWVKNYDGNPVEGADEYNNIYRSGVLRFPITEFSESQSVLQGWLSSNWCNELYGIGFSPASIAQLTERGKISATNNTIIVGPTTYKQASWASGTGIQDADVIAILAQSGSDTNVAGWDWLDEAPDNWKYPQSVLHKWYLWSHQTNSSKFVHLNIQGIEFNGYGGAGNRTMGKAYSYPWLSSDFISYDDYPYEFTNTSNWGFAQACSNANAWNFGVIPVFVYVQTTDVRPGTGGGTPQTNQIELLAWEAIASGAKGLHWYPYNGTMTIEPITMKRVCDDMDALKYPILLGTNMTWVTETNAGTNLLITTKTYLGTNWIVACNLSSNSVIANLVDTNLTTPQAINNYHGGSISSGTGFFSDTIPAQTAIIYKYILPQGSGPTTPIIGISPSSLSFLIRRADTTTGTFVVTNVGTGTLTGNATTSDTGYSVTSGGAYSLDVGQGQTVTVTFNPNKVSGEFLGTITLTGGGGASIVLTGNSTNFPTASQIGKVTTAGKVTFY